LGLQDTRGRSLSRSVCPLTDLGLQDTGGRCEMPPLVVASPRGPVFPLKARFAGSHCLSERRRSPDGQTASAIDECHLTVRPAVRPSSPWPPASPSAGFAPSEGMQPAASRCADSHAACGRPSTGGSAGCGEGMGSLFGHPMGSLFDSGSLWPSDLSSERGAAPLARASSSAMRRRTDSASFSRRSSSFSRCSASCSSACSLPDRPKAR
jgi:hypothetical protein